MSIWRRLYGSIRGGWRTYGPGSGTRDGAFASSDSDDGFGTPGVDDGMTLSAFHSCVSLKSEIVGSLPLQLRDANKQPVTDHPLTNVLMRSPNAHMTPPEFWSLATAYIEMKGNSVNIIARGAGKKVVALTPVDPDDASFEYSKSGRRKTWKIGNDTHDDDDILHLRGFSTDPDWGQSRLESGRQILMAQLTANRSAMLAFKQGLKVGGFFANEGTTNLTDEQLLAFARRLNEFSQPANQGKWMTLPRALKPIAGTEFSVKPAEAQLLESRNFGIEEICRLCSTPPQLIGHSNKASSWASSIENINLFYLMYNIQPSLIRHEASIMKKLLTAEDAVRGIRPKFNVRGLLRANMKAQSEVFASALQNGYHNVDEVRDLLDMPELPNGEGKVYRVQLNMAGAQSPEMIAAQSWCQGDDK